MNRFLGFAVVFLLDLTAVAVAANAVTAPAYFPNENWVYQTVRNERAEEMGYKSEVGEYEIRVSADGSLSLDPTLADSLPSVYEGPKTFSGIEWFRFPLQKGDSWPVQYNIGWQRGSQWRDGIVRVVAKETVTVPAGTFEAYRLMMEQGGGKEYDIEYWYSPKTKAVVKIVQKRYRRGELLVLRELVLISYSVHK